MPESTTPLTTEQTALEVMQCAFGPDHHVLEIWADMPGDDNACHAAVNQSREIADFLVRSEGYEVFVSLFGEEDQPFGFTLIINGDDSDSLPAPNVLSVHDDGRMAFTYLISTDEPTTDITALAKAVKPGNGDDRELSADMPLPGAGWSLDSRTTYNRYAVAALREAFGLSAEKGMSADVPPHWNVIGDFPAGVLDHPVHASKLPRQCTKKANNVFADVRGLYNHIAQHPESDEKEGAGIVGTLFDKDIDTGKPRRKIRNAMTVGFIGFDFDGGQTEEDAVARLRERGITFATYSSFNHLRDGETHKFRVIIPLAIPFDTSNYKSREHANAVWKATYEHVADELGFECDLNTKDIARFFNSPRHPAGGEYFSHIYGGELFELPIVEPSESKVAKIAKKRGVKLNYDTTGEVSVHNGSGLEFFLSLIGDGEDQMGFHYPIYSAMCAYFADDPEAEIGPIIGTARKAVEAAIKGPARSSSDIERYLSDAYLFADANNAKEFIAERKQRDRDARQRDFDDARAMADELNEDSPDEDINSVFAKMANLKETERERVFNRLKTAIGMSPASVRRLYRDWRALQADAGEEKSSTRFESMEEALKAMNEEIALVGRGSGVMILRQRPDGEDDWKTEKAAETWYAPWQAGQGSNREAVFPVWREWENRRRFEGVVFEPDGCSPDFYNMYKGFAIEPMKSDWHLMQRHWFHVICNGNIPLFEYYMAWFAHMVQSPGEKPGTALVLPGPKGSGKGIAIAPLLQIWGPRHSVKVANNKQLVGNFNNHMAGKILVVGEESTWGGDRQTDNSLKDMITSETMMLEAKYENAVPVSDYRRFILPSNEKNVVRATPDERRYAATLVSGAHINDWQYFDPLIAGFKDGTFAPAMLYDLLQHDFSSVNLRQPPRNDALVAQILENLPTADEWLRSVLAEGTFLDEDDTSLLTQRQEQEWKTQPIQVPREKVFQSYRSMVTAYGKKEASASEIGAYLHDAFKHTGVEISTTRSKANPREYLFPPLPELIEAYDTKFGLPLDFESVESREDFIRPDDPYSPDAFENAQDEADEYLAEFFRS
ncbi:MAG: hypothetical protein KDK08_26895 [Rhizobiaceae bacterium]|nr:hypothetical protein [Rhizobiaceae bacterium]